MHFNKSELFALACQPSHNFNKEGVLLFLEKQDSFFRKSEVHVERWCRLRGNLLFYFKSKDHCSEPAGVLVLENFQIIEEDTHDINHSFTLVYHETSHILSAVNAKEKASWVSLLQRASLSYMKAQIDTLLHHIIICHQNIPVSIQKYRMDSGASIDLCKPPFLELSICCDNLRCDSNGIPPNPRVSVYALKPPHKIWILYAQTEVIESTSNPSFLSTVTFRNCDGIDGETRLCFIISDVREKVSDTSLHLGKTMITLQSLLEAGRMRLFLLSPHKHTVGFITLNTWLVNSDYREAKDKCFYATPKHHPVSNSPKPFGHRRTQSLPPKLSCQLKHPSHGSINFIYENPAVSTFRFHSGLGGDIAVMEIMAEPFLCYQFPQQLLKLWITEEQLCHEEIISLGDLTEEWKTRQLTLLNQHATLISMYGIAQSTMETNVSAGINFRKSMERNESSLEFAPINLHLQRLFGHNESLRRLKFYDIMTVGAFSANSLGFKQGGLSDMLHRAKSLHTQSGTAYKDKAGSCEDTIDHLRRMRKEIILQLRLLILSLQKKEVAVLMSVFGQLQEKTNLLLHILDPNLVDEAFEFLDQIRLPQDPPHALTIASREFMPSNDLTGYTSPEQALDMELASPIIHNVFEDTDHGKKLLDEVGGHGCHSYKAKLEEGLSEFCVNSCYKSTDEPEPWDLIQLNIRASLFCLSGKVEAFTEKYVVQDNNTKVEDCSRKRDASKNNLLPNPSCLPSISISASSAVEKNQNEFVETMMASGHLSVDVSPCDDSGIVADHRADKSEEEANLIIQAPVTIPAQALNKATANCSTRVEVHGENLVEEGLRSKTNESRTLDGSHGGGIEKNSRKSPGREEIPDGEWIAEVRPSIRKLRQAMDGLMRIARLTHSVFRLKEDLESSQLSHAIKYRKDICFSQALTSVVTGLLTKIWCKKVESNFATVLTKLGPLILFEGLLSCYRAESGRLSDMIVAVEDLAAVDFVMVPAGVFSQAGRRHDSPSQHKIPLPRITGTRKAMRVILPVPEQMLSILPCSTRGHPADPPSFRVTPVFFNIGINEEATLSAKLCKDGAQYRNNHNNYYRLLHYFNLFKTFFPLEEENKCNTLSSPLFRRRKESLNALFVQLHRDVFQQQPKNVAVLQTAAKICRAMDGLRFTSCKSAKDRTAMSVTLEEVLVLQEDLDLSQSEFRAALDCIRSEGTRLRNCTKNVGRPKYAFSSLQLSLFPPQYKPPSGTFGANLT